MRCRAIARWILTARSTGSWPNCFWRSVREPAFHPRHRRTGARPGGHRRCASLTRTNEDFAIGIGDNRTRAAVATRLRGSLRFPSLIHPDAGFGRGSRGFADAAIGAAVFAGVRATNNVRFGDFAIVNLSATLSHDVELGDFASVSPGANIAGNVRVGEGALIGVGAAINQGDDLCKLGVGAWTVIGSGAVVTRDCEANSVYVGVPARKIR
ncbi:MAG: hypothetical protein EOP61_43080 [Sphingomonadales bacterium]|nr:MAG: hypothetical protein EOP61_43080 [Sphingomonadales bacterium]